MADKLSRRDFLKVAGAAGAALAGEVAGRGKPARALSEAQMLIEREKSFETKYAIFIPFYEAHTNRDSDEGIIKSEPDYFFTEIAVQSDYVLSAKSSDLLTLEGESGFGIFKRDTGPFFDPVFTVALDIIDSKVILEGVNIPDAYIWGQTAKDVGITGLASLGFGSQVLNVMLKKFVDEKPVNRADWSKLLISAFILGETSINELEAAAGVGVYSLNKDLPGVKTARELASRFNSVISMTHPEDVIVFLRNVLMSLKMLTVAEQNPKKTPDKPRIAFRVGGGHSAITDLLQYGRDINLTLLEVYPDWLLKQVIDYNLPDNRPLRERIHDFCKVVLIDVKKARATGEGKEYLVDTDLEEYLSKRLHLGTKGSRPGSQ